MVKYKKIAAHMDRITNAMDYTPIVNGVTVKDCLRLGVQSVLELDRLIDDMPKLSSPDVSSDEVVQFLSDWHDWQMRVTEARRGDV